MATRVKTREKMYLLDTFADDIKGSKLPSNRQVLGHFLYRHRKGFDGETLRCAATKTVEKIQEFWDRARIPVRHKQDSIKKVEVLFYTWKALKKNASRRTVNQIKKEDDFKNIFDDLFDIAHADALTMIQIEEDRQFLLAQREKGRRGAMAAVDKSTTMKEQKQQEKLKLERKRRFTAEKKAEELNTSVNLASSSSSAEESAEDEPVPCAIKSIDKPIPDHRKSDDEPIPGPSESLEPSPKRGRKAVLTPALSATLDRTKVSDRAAMMIVTETARSLGHDIEALTLNRQSIRRQRQHHREATANNILEQFNPEPDEALIVHWDGKLLVDLTGKEKVDRLPVLVSSGGKSQLLAVPKLLSGTGEAQAQAVMNTLKQWNIQDNVQGMCFDTTTSNTGRHKGACLILEQLIGRELLHLGCRHHIMELLAGAAFTEVIGATSAPDVLLFKRFQSRWEFIDQEGYEDSSTDEFAAKHVSDIREDMVQWLEASLTKIQPRDDYRELLELAMIFLGSSPPRGIRFAAPGAMHHARWMAKVIYTFKIWMFRSQFKLTAREQKGLRDLCIFFSRLYVKAWTTAPLAVAAPQNDLHLLQSLEAYKTIHAGISKATSKKMASHLWYLSEELVGLSLFDDAVTHNIKNLMVKAMGEVEGDEDPPKRATVDVASVNKTVADFTTMKTKTLIAKLGLSGEFLHSPASQWEDNPQYQAAKAVARKLAVTNDHAERGVALVQDFSGRLTKNEEQLQFILQVVADHRKKFPQALKQTMIGQSP